MIISNSSIGMDSARTYTSVSREAYLTSGKITPFGGIFNLKADSNTAEETSDKSDKADTSSKESSLKNDFDSIYNKMKSYAANGSYERSLEKQQLDTIRQKCIQFLLLLLLGENKEIDMTDTAVGNTDVSSDDASEGETVTTLVHYSYSYSEAEETTFSTSGNVVTKDGREISFGLDLTMSRSFTSRFDATKLAQTFRDPLVINFDSLHADVSDVKIKFDLDADGTEEEINRLSEGSGYLSLDLNGDGKINDGSELFGTKSGDGFADLASYDKDGNGWIDEADEIFDKLKIYVQNEDGSQTLYSLKDKNIGAIYLGHADTEFSLNSMETNRTNAKIRSTGIFLYETGYTGTLQHLDLAQ